MCRSKKSTPGLLIALAVLLLPTTTPAEVFRMTAGGPQSTNLPWIGVIQRVVVPESNARLRAAGSPHSIVWREAYGGSLYKWQNTLEAIEIGLADIGWVGAMWEGSKMPLQNVTYNTPFITDDLALMLDIFNDLHDRMPALRRAWDDQNQILLGASGVDTYHLLTTFPVEGVADLQGHKILAPGPSATWLEGTGAVAVNGGLNTYYTQIRTGVAEGVLTILSGAYPYRIHEVAPYVTLVSIGAQFNGGMAMNKNTWERLPPELQQIFRDLGREYSSTMAAEATERYDRALDAMAAEGATITTLTDTERQKWIDGLPDLAGRWVAAAERRGHPARAVLEAFMDEFRRRGGEPARNWDAAQ
jgi:TRAP-type C4-dicarboxylate transport system substrate-binding protein